MCGYIQRTAKIPKIDRILQGWNIAEPLPPGRFWPGTQMSGVVIADGGDVRAVEATWWFLLEDKGGTLKPNRKVTCFNARNLNSQLWRAPFKSSRCIIPASAIVETKGSQSYLMDAPEGVLLGGVYRMWAIGDSLAYSCSVITCDPHPRFSQYHDKSIPLFLPPDPKLLNTWLDHKFTDTAFFGGLIDHVRISTDFQVTRVNNSQKLDPQGQTELLKKD